MNEKKFFDKINFNKRWDESDWEIYFQAQDDYRVSKRLDEIRKKPLSKIQFEGSDEVAAFEPIMREYGLVTSPAVFEQLHSKPFEGDTNPEEDYHPSTQENPHYWGEGVPLSNLLIYRDACRFAIFTSLEIDRYLRRRGPSYRRKHSGTFEALRFHAHWVAINVGQGHRIGYGKDRIRGNIAKCRRALKHAETCLSHLSQISSHTKSLRLRKELFSFAVQLRNALFYWIDELRLRVR